MAFLAICSALYDYTPQSEGELLLEEGELVYILEKSDEDDWWKAKKRALNDEEEEPVGLIPNNYVEEVGQRSFKWFSGCPSQFRCLLNIRDCTDFTANRRSQLITPKHFTIIAGKPMKNYPSRRILP